MQTYDVRLVTSTGVVLAEHRSFVYSQGLGVGDMLRARVWHAVHPQERVWLEVTDADSGEHVLTMQLMPRESVE